MRKLNAYIGYLMALCYIVHGVEESLVMQGVIPYNDGQKNGGRTLMVLVLVHVIITLVLLLSNRKSGILKPKIFIENGSTYIQRYTGIALLILAIIHGIGNVWVDGGSIITLFRDYPVIHCIMEVLFIIVACIHLNISLEKAAVTLGWIRSERSRKIIKIVTCSLVTVSSIFAIYGFTCYYILN